MESKKIWLALLAIAILGGLDLCAAYLAKEYSLRPRPIVFAGGMFTFGVLFFVYARSLRVSELWVVTFGWVVLLEIGVLVVDRLYFRTHIPPHKIAVATAIIALQVLLVLPSGTSTTDTSGRPVATDLSSSSNGVDVQD